jgi:hypothetical protein
MKSHKIRLRPVPANHISSLLILLSLFLRTVSADEVLINDGSRIKGEVMRHDTTVLKLKTSFLGTVEIKWAEIVEVTLTEPGIEYEIDYDSEPGARCGEFQS